MKSFMWLEKRPPHVVSSDQSIQPDGWLKPIYYNSSVFIYGSATGYLIAWIWYSSLKIVYYLVKCLDFLNLPMIIPLEKYKLERLVRMKIIMEPPVKLLYSV